MPDLSKRKFLTRGSVAVALGGAAATVPGLGSILQSTAGAQEAPHKLSDDEISVTERGGPLVAHVTDLKAGKVTLYHGQGQLEFTNPSWVAQMHHYIPKGEQ